jgi:hypothetical protein
MHPAVMLVQIQAAAIDEERHRGEERRHARHRSRVLPVNRRPSARARLAAASLAAVRRERHALTAYPCRLADGKIGRTAVIQRDGEWVLVCRVA